jgi:hypothetical protein
VRDRAAIFLTLLLAYAWFFGGSGFNQNATFDLTRALVERHQLAIDPYAGNTVDVSFHAGHVYSNKAPGLAFAAAIPYAIAHALLGPARNAMQLNAALYVCTVAVCGVSGALIGVLLFSAAIDRGASRRTAVLLALLTGLGTPLFAYSTMLFAHVPSALLILTAYEARRRGHPLRAGLAAGGATFINYLSLPLALLFIPRRGFARYVAGGAPFAIALAAYQLAAFGSPFKTSIATMNPAFIERGAMLGIFHLPRLDALWGITFSPYRGLFYIAPFLLVALAGLRDWTIAAAFGVLLLLNASFNGWHGGYAIGPRYLLAVVPLLALELLNVRTRWLQPVLIATALVSLFFNFAATAVDPQPPDNLRDPLGRYEIPSLITGFALPDARAPWLHDLYTGHTSTNRVAPDELLPFQHHAPGSRESEWASFNLGEFFFGAGSAASLLPWLALTAIILASCWGRSPAFRTTPGTRTD